MLLLTSWWPIPFDVYLLKYPTGTNIPEHTDVVHGARHCRLNIILRKGGGGVFSCEKCIINTSRIVLFRPDINKHSVSPITKGSRIVLSIGWLLS